MLKKLFNSNWFQLAWCFIFALYDFIILAQLLHKVILGTIFGTIMILGIIFWTYCIIKESKF